MREISPVGGQSVEEYVRRLPPQIKQLVARIREQKNAGSRVLPSQSLVDRSTLTNLSREKRSVLLDKVAELVDENLFGRSEMCIQFAVLLDRALSVLNCPSRVAIGKAVYYSSEGKVLHEWDHAWVRVGDEVVDGNVDSVYENPMVPPTVRLAPYWGPVTQTPADRKLREDHNQAPPPPDEDVETFWWPELKEWIVTAKA